VVSNPSVKYEFVGGFPSTETVAEVYDQIDLNRAVSAYRFFFPSVSFYTVYKGNLQSGAVANSTFVVVTDALHMRCFTPNSDTPYAGLVFDVSDGPMVLELPPGPLMGTVNDLNQLWVLDCGLPGPDHGQGGKHLMLPPDYDGPVPDGYNVGRGTTNRLINLLRALPAHGDLAGAIDLVKTVKVYPLGGEPVDLSWVDLDFSVEYSPASLELGMGYWETLNELIQNEPANPDYRFAYADLAELGMVKGQPFEPDERMTKILVQAAEIGHAQLCVESFADRRNERVVWPGTQWEWAVLRPESGTFDAGSYNDLYAREKWFYQAQVESPAMFARAPGAGSLYWAAAKDANGDYFDGSNTYKLSVPLPVPDKLFWSLTLYDAETRAEMAAEQPSAALRSLVELTPQRIGDGDHLELFVGPEQPEDAEGRWLQSNPGKGWFVYFRIYGPEEAAFDGSWQLGDFQRLS
jgi:hypothetical protein